MKYDNTYIMIYILTYRRMKNNWFFKILCHDLYDFMI